MKDGDEDVESKALCCFVLLDMHSYEILRGLSWRQNGPPQWGEAVAWRCSEVMFLTGFRKTC